MNELSNHSDTNEDVVQKKIVDIVEHQTKIREWAFFWIAYKIVYYFPQRQLVYSLAFKYMINAIS